MSEKPISPLRRRMIEDMSVRKFGEKTQHDYIRHIENFARFLGRLPDTATAEDLRRYQVHQTETGVQPPSVNSSAVALRFLFTVTLGRANLATQLTRVHYPRRLPRVLSPEEVARLLEAAPGPGLKYKAALSVAYGAGLRASRSGLAEGLRYRQQAPAEPGRAGQGAQGPSRHAVAATAGSVARVVAAVPVAGLAVPGTRPIPADFNAAVQPRLPHGGRHRRARWLGLSAYAAAQLRNPSPGEPYRRARHPGSARTRQARYDGALCPGRHQPAANRHQSARSPD